MVMIKKSITVTDQQDSWLKAQISTGHYGNESELLRELIRERQLREQESVQELEAIRAKLIEAEQSPSSKRTSEELLSAIENGLRRK